MLTRLPTGTIIFFPSLISEWDGNARRKCVRRFLGYIVWYGGIAMLIYGLNECGCSLATQVVPVLAVPFGPKFVCAASAAGIELARRNPSKVGFGLFCVWFLLWRSLVGASIAAAIAWLIIPQLWPWAVAGGAVIGLIKTIQYLEKPKSKPEPRQRAVALLPPPSRLSTS
jgi:hypothetical protein